MRLRSLPGLLLLAIALLFVVPSAAEYYTDWLWFRELGYEGIFLRTLNAQSAAFSITFAIVFTFVYVNLRIHLVLLTYVLILLTTIVLYLLACDPLPPCVGRVREWWRGLSSSRVALPESE